MSYEHFSVNFCGEFGLDNKFKHAYLCILINKTNGLRMYRTVCCIQRTVCCIYRMVCLVYTNLFKFDGETSNVCLCKSRSNPFREPTSTSNEGKVSCSWKQRGPLLGSNSRLTGIHRLRVRRATHYATSPHLLYIPYGLLYIPHGLQYIQHSLLYISYGQLYIPYGLLYIPHGLLYIPHGLL